MSSASIEVGDLIEHEGIRMKVVAVETGSWTLRRIYTCQR